MDAGKNVTTITRIAMLEPEAGFRSTCRAPRNASPLKTAMGTIRASAKLSTLGMQL